MGVYSGWIFPRLVRWAMSQETIREQRRPALAQAHGEVLEIGFGPGLNLPFYPDTVSRLTAIDSSPGMLTLARSQPAPFPLQLEVLNGERLPFQEAAFDCVVSTWTLCSIDRVEQALAEIRRVLRPGGLFLFVEHGRSAEPKERRWQDRLTPIQRRIAGGCRLNRDIPALVTGAGLEMAQLERFYLDKAPRLLGYTFRGQARRGP